MVWSLTAAESKEMQHKTGSSLTNAAQLLSTVSYTTHLSPVLVIPIMKTGALYPTTSTHHNSKEIS
jgi:hypothetical protein